MNKAMEKDILQRYSQGMVWRGIAALIFACFALMWPGLTLVAIVILFAIYLFADGALALFMAIRASLRHQHWGLLLIEGMAGIFVGAFALLWPGVTTIILLYLIATWAVITGIFEIWAALVLPWHKDGRLLVGIAGVLSLALGILMLVYPATALTVIIVLVGIYALVFGVVLIALGFILNDSQRKGKKR